MLDHNITPMEFQKVIDFLKSTQVPSEFFRSNLLFMLEKHFDYSVSSLWLVNEAHEMYDPISYNLDRRVIKSYQDYYYKFDPFHPIYMTESQLQSKPVLTLEDIPLTQYPQKDAADNPYFSFLSDEFKISQDVILSFKVGAQEYGSAALFTKHGQSANKMMFINCLNIITPFIAQMLCQNLQLLDLKFRTETLESVVCALDDGILMFDGNGNVLYYNTQALRFLQDISGKAFSADTLHEFIFSLLPAVYRAGERVERSGGAFAGAGETRLYGAYHPAERAAAASQRHERLLPFRKGAGDRDAHLARQDQPRDRRAAVYLRSDGENAYIQYFSKGRRDQQNFPHKRPEKRKIIAKKRYISKNRYIFVPVFCVFRYFDFFARAKKSK